MEWKTPLWLASAMLIALAALPGGSAREKARIEAREEKAREDAKRKAIPKPRDPATLRPASVPDPLRFTGIVWGIQGPFGAGELRVENAWQERIAGEWVQVFAGSIPDDPEQGVVALRIEPQEVAIFPAPWRRGALRIVSVRGRDVLLESRDGARSTFDLVTRSFSP